jgi:hypothetical protein
MGAWKRSSLPHGRVESGLAATWARGNGHQVGKIAAAMRLREARTDSLRGSSWECRILELARAACFPEFATVGPRIFMGRVETVATSRQSPR